MTKKTALITGVTGQDGSYMAELLLSKGYRVFGIVRNNQLQGGLHGVPNLAPLLNHLEFIGIDLESSASVHKLVTQVMPTEVYHFAAPSFVSYSLDEGLGLFNQSVAITFSLLSAVKDCSPSTKVYFSGTSELFGAAQTYPQNESTPFLPRSVYGIAKLASFHLVRNFREKHRLFATSGILYNHESPRRRKEFVTRKISAGVARIKIGLEKELFLGNLDAKRDWGYAPEYVEAMWKMMQLDSPVDLVLATGEVHTVREFVKLAFSHVDLNYEDFVRIDDRYFRPAESIPLVGDASLAKKLIGWKPKTDLKSIVGELVDADLASLT